MDSHFWQATSNTQHATASKQAGPSRQVQYTFRDKWHADGTFWAMGDPIGGLLWLTSGRFEPFCPPETPFRVHLGRKRMFCLYISWATWLKLQYRGHFSRLQPPTFSGLQPSDRPQGTARTAVLARILDFGSCAVQLMGRCAYWSSTGRSFLIPRQHFPHSLSCM